MRRVICIFLPHWPMEARLRRLAPDAAPPPDKAAVIASMEERLHTVLAVNAAAAADGIAPGMSLAHARAVQPRLAVLPAEPLEDARALARLAAWCLRYSPLVAPCPPDGVWIDATGATHLFGGEDKMLAVLRDAFAAHGLSSRAAMAQTPGAAWALAHFGPRQAAVSQSPGDLGPLPVAALRVGMGTARAMWRVGLKTVADLRRVPRATLPHRFGAEVLTRLDQALGHAPEAIDAMLPPRARRRQVAFAEPIGTPEDLKRAVGLLVPPLCADLEATQHGARAFDLLFHRIDNRTAPIRLGLARPSRDPAHIARLLAARIETVDPGFGVERATLTAWRVSPLVPRQTDHGDGGGAAGDIQGPGAVAALVDALAAQVGSQNIYRIAAVASDIPERAARRTAPLAALPAAWPTRLPRPVRLLAPPEPVEVVALMPDHPPARFTWRGEIRRIRHADGPERIYGEWWQARREIAEVRDYFRVEDEQGERFWLYRDARPTPAQTFRWYLHGMFA